MRRVLLPLLTLALAPAAAGAATSVSSTPTFAAGALALDGAGSATPRIVKVATVDVQSDAPGGFTLSAWAGALEKATGETPIPLQVVAVPAGAAAPSAGDFTAPAGAPFTHRSAQPGAALFDLYIRFTPAALQDPGDYAASVQLSVADN
jgi:hypothetical protein